MHARSRRRLAVLAGLALLAVAPGCSRAGGGGEGEGDAALAAASPFVAVDPASASPTDRAIAEGQDRLRENGGDDSSRLKLAQAFLQKVRETGDPTLYTRVDDLLAEATRGRKNDPSVMLTQGTLALARHEFADALDLGRKAVALAPGNVGALGVVVDALNELGRYDEALEATQRLADARPSLSSLARVSYARELRGDLEGAVSAMTQAVTAGAGSGENVAYIQVQLGNLLLNKGDVAGAEASYAEADQSFPGFPLAKAGRARALVARGEPGPAADLLAEVAKVLPTAEHVIAQGDALAAAGRKAEATAAYDLVDVIAKLYRANGVNVDLELALFAADHKPGDDVVKDARRAAAARPSVAGHDALAWSLFTAGKADQAWSQAKKALALGTRDPQVRFHAAVIAMTRGERDTAISNLTVVLETNPRFSAVQVPAVARLAGQLGLTVPPPVPSPLPIP